MPYKARPLWERLWAKIDASGDCWLWTGARQRSGYGRIMVSKGRFDLAHRVSYRLTRGEIPEGMFVLHSCDNPQCVKPAHLFVGTQADNMRDCRAKGRWQYKARNQSGERNPNAILSDAVVAAMLAELAAGARPVATARKYGISYKTLWAIRRRKP